MYSNHLTRFMDCEAWRKEIDLDNLVPTWEYPEKTEIQKYYKQFYHKIDKVSNAFISYPETCKEC